MLLRALVYIPLKKAFMTTNPTLADITVLVKPSPAPQQTTATVAIPGTVIEGKNLQYADETVIDRDGITGRVQDF